MRREATPSDFGMTLRGRPTGDLLARDPGREASPSRADPPSAPTAPLHRMPSRQPPNAPTGGPADEPPVFPARLFARPHSVLVYGSTLPLVNLTLFALASHTNPEFHWVEIGRGSEELTPCNPIQLGWIPDDRLWLVDSPDSLRPNDASMNLPLFEMIRSDEPPDSLQQFTEFLRLPEISQRILASHSPDGRPGVVAVTNVHRVGDVFSAESVPRILSVHRNAGFSVLVGAAGSSGPGRDLFDFVFRLQGPGVESADWRHHQLVCERGISSGPLRELRPVRLDEIPLLEQVLSKAQPSS